MRKNKDNIAEHDDGTYVVKKSRKSSILAFILCFLLAVVIWSYAEAEEKRQEEKEKQNQQQIADIVETADRFTDTAKDEG